MTKAQARKVKSDETSVRESSAREKETRKVEARKVEGKKPELKRVELKKVEPKKVEPKKLEKKAEPKKPEAKKSEAKKSEAKKSESKKPELKRVEPKQADAKKVELKKAAAKKVETSKPEPKKPEAKKPELKKVVEAKKPEPKKAEVRVEREPADKKPKRLAVVEPPPPPPVALVTPRREEAAVVQTFRAGDKAVYPGQGVGEVLGIEHLEIAGARQAFYVLKILENGMKIRIPINKVGSVGLRDVIGGPEVEEVYSILKTKTVAVDSTTWNRRYREYMEKIKTGSVFEIAAVLRDLYLLKYDKDLSFGERKMLDTARSLLVKELAIAKSVTEDEIEGDLRSIFNC